MMMNASKTNEIFRLDVSPGWSIKLHTEHEIHVVSGLLPGDPNHLVHAGDGTVHSQWATMNPQRAIVRIQKMSDDKMHFRPPPFPDFMEPGDVGFTMLDTSSYPTDFPANPLPNWAVADGFSVFIYCYAWLDVEGGANHPHQSDIEFSETKEDLSSWQLAVRSAQSIHNSVERNFDYWVYLDLIPA